MRKQEQIRVIEGLMKHLDNDTNVDAGGQRRNPVSAYLSADRARQEWDRFFLDHPHLLGLSADLPQPQSFFTSNDLGKPILCTRTQEGEFKAFLNVCRHRGTIVENEARGQKRFFHCPFHAWTYDHGGALVGVPKEAHFGKVDRECNSLVELPAVEKYGLLFVNPNPQGSIDVDDLLGDMGPEIANYRLDEVEFNASTRYDHPMNWKLAIDTFGETYHFETLHRNTLAENFYGNVQMYDTFKRNHRMALCLKSIDGLRKKAQEDWDVLDAALPVYYIFPNIQLIIGKGGPTLVRVYPSGPNPNDSYSEISFYFAAELNIAELAPNNPLISLRELVSMRMEGFGNVIEQEDYVAAASSHRGMLSGAQTHLTFGRNEPALHHYHNTYNEALGLPELPLEPTSD